MSLKVRVSSAASNDAAISRVRFRILSLVGSLSLLTYLDRICISRLQGEIQRDLGLSDIEMGAVFSAFLVGYALFEIPVGWLSDMWGPRSIILRIVLWWSFFTALTGAVFNFLPESRLWLPLPWGWVALSWGFVTMIAVRFLFGCGEAGVYPALSNVVRTWFPLTERAMAQGVIIMSSRFGAAMAPWVVGRLADNFGWRGAFVVLGLLGVAWSLLFVKIFRERPADHPGVRRQELALIGTASVANVHGGPRLPWREALRSPTVWALGAILILSNSFGWAFYLTWQGRYLLDVHGFKFRDSELWTGLPYLCGAAGTVLGGVLSDQILLRTKSVRWARSLVGMVGLGGAGGCFLAASVAHGRWEAVAFLSLAAFSSDLFMAPFFAAMTDVGGRFTGTLVGCINMLGVLGASLFVLYIPWLLKQHVPWEQVLQRIGCALLAAAALWLIVDAGRPLLPRDEPHV